VSKTAGGADRNGATGKQAASGPKDAPKVRPRDLRQARFAVTFSQIVAVLMRDPSFRRLRLADLEWLVLPPVMAGQFRLAQAPVQPNQPKAAAGKPAAGKAASAQAGADKGQAAAPQVGDGGGMLVPVAVALWARVSPQIDKALSENLDKQVRLHPTQWASGNNLWLMAVAGDQRALPAFLKQLREHEFKGKVVKTRVRGADGKVAIKTLSGKTA
jgi:cytolysin-activating lysine-acyltransferase